LLTGSGATERGDVATSRLNASDTGRRPFTAFTRLAGVFVGLVNLLVLADPNGVVIAYQMGNVGWYEALPPVLAVMIAGLVTSEVVLRWLEPVALAEKFSHRYGISVFAVCLGGTLMGFLLAAALTLNRVLVPGPDTLLERIPVSLIPGLVGAVFGLGLGLVEGLFLALPLAVILGRFRNRS
jgi:hypothetical protein